MSHSPWARVASQFSRRLTFWPAVAITLLLAMGSLPSPAQSAQQPTDFSIGNTVLHSPVKRLGIDLGAQSYWDSSQILRNLIYRNPGFEGETWRTAIHCQTGTATTCVDWNSWNVWPANFLQGGSLEVISGAGIGQTTSITGNTVSAFGAGNTTNPNYGMTISFNKLSTPLSNGDWIIVSSNMPGDAQAGWWTSTSGGATLTTDTADLAPDSPGKQALQMNANGNGQTASVNQAFDTLDGHSFVQLKGTYTLQFKAKGLGGNNQLSITIVRLATVHGNENFLNQNVTLTNQWQDYSYNFTADEDGTYIGPVQVIFSVSGASADLDDVALMAPAAPDNPTAFRNEVVDTLRQLHPGVIRYMTGTDFGASTADIVAPPFARWRAGVNSQASEQEDVPMGLEDFLVLCQAVGAEPWYTMSGEASPQDMQNLIEFLGGSASTPYGAIRASQGQTAPWTSVFPVIHLELGNEMWNGSMPGEAITDPVIFGHRAKQVFSAARSAPGYDPSKFDLILGSWAAVPWYTQQEMANSGGFDSVDAAPYLFNSLSDYSSNEAIFGPMFAQPEQVDSTPNGYMAQQAATAAAGNPPAKLDVYEVNLSTVAGTAPQQVVNSVVGGVGAGIAVADHMLLMMRDLGITTQNMFALTGYLNGFNNTATGAGETTPLWGSVIDMGGPTNRKRPTFLAEELANSAIMPTMLQVGVSGANPTWNQPSSANDDQTPIQLNNAHYLQSFAFTDGTNYSIVIMNLSRSGALPVTFSGAHAPSGSVMVSQLTSASPTDNNETSNVVQITHQNLTGFSSTTPYSLPPFSMTVFQWPNGSLPATTTALVASPTSGTSGQNIQLTATVSGASAANTPTGTVSFMNGSSNLGTAQLDQNGVATLGVTTLPAGADSVTAVYGGDAGNAGSTSSAVIVDIDAGAASTTTTLAASPTQAAPGATVTFTATVKPQSGNTVPTGSVTFNDGATSLGSAALSASGTAAFSTSSLAAGTHSVTASYGGSSGAGSSTSSAVTVTITQQAVATSTSLTASATQITSGSSVSFTAKVTPQSGTDVPTGTVTFLDSGKTIGTQTLNGSGAATFSTSSLAVGSHSITASYAGASADSSSVSAAVTVTVAQATVDTTTTLTASASQINTGQAVTFTAKVAAKSGSTAPSGTVTFSNGGAALGMGTLNASGVAAFTTSSLPAGTASITAAYSASQGFNGSTSPAVTVTVTQAAVDTTTTLTASASQINTGQAVTFTAKVAAKSGSTAPSGTVTFSNGGAALGTGTLNASGVAAFTTSSLPAGTASITAAYSAGQGFNASTSPAVTVTVTQAAVDTSTSLTASASQISTGQSVTFTATVAANSGSTFSPMVAGKSGSKAPSGTVTFSNGGVALGTGVLNASGVTTFTTSSLPAGTASITAAYSASQGFNGSTSPAVAVTVMQAAVDTTTTLSASASQINAGQAVTLTAMVAAKSGSKAPSGTVTFSNGGAVLGTAALGAGGAAAFTTSSLPAGTDSITAVYSGGQGFTGSTSSAVVVGVTATPSAVTHIGTSVVLAVSDPHPISGSTITFTASIVPQSGSGTPTGTVSFSDGQTMLGHANVNGAKALFRTDSLSIGSHQITASYSGDSAYAGSVSPAVSVNVGAVAAAADPAAAPTATTLIASPSQVNEGQAVTLNASVQFASGGPVTDGTVKFLDGGSVLGTGTLDSKGHASFSTSSLPLGTQSITAGFDGTPSAAASTSAAVAVGVLSAGVTPRYTLSLSASNVRVRRGQVANLTVTVTPQAGFNLPVHLTCSGMLPYTNCSFSPIVVSPDGKPASSTLSILAQAPSGTMSAESGAPQGGSTAQKIAFGALMPWGLVALFGLRRKNRSRFASWAIRLGVVAILIAGSLWLSGCGYSANQSAFTMTVTSSAANIPAQTSTVTVNVVP